MYRAIKIIGGTIGPGIVAAWLLFAGAARADELPAVSLPIPHGDQASPPLGYLNFCERHADQCGTDTQTPMALAESSTDENFPAAFKDTSGPRAGFDWGAVFAPSAARKPASSGEAMTDAPLAKATSHVENQSNGVSYSMTQTHWQELRNTNAFVNRQVRSVSDLEHYGVKDFWELPIENGGNSGDCEDYVLEKRKILMKQGVPMGALSIALVKTSWNAAHAVLLVHTDKGTYVLDNLTPLIKPWKEVAYTWVKWQLPNNPNIWVLPLVSN